MDAALLSLSILTLALAAALAVTVVKMRRHRHHTDTRIDQLAADLRSRSGDLVSWLGRLDARLLQVERWHRVRRLDQLVERADSEGQMRPDAAQQLRQHLSALSNEVMAAVRDTSSSADEAP